MCIFDSFKFPRFPFSHRYKIDSSELISLVNDYVNRILETGKDESSGTFLDEV